jgi:energy-coupling factor transport system ATP-binding protein
VLERLAHEVGVCVIVAEHATAEWSVPVDDRLEIRDRELHPAGPAAPVPQIRGTGDMGAHIGGDIARVDGLTVTMGDTTIVDDAALTLRAGELVALQGPNGAGKSTLLDAMARPRTAGAVLVSGQDVHALRRRARRRAVALVPEAFDDLLFSTTVVQECRRADRRAGTTGTARRFAAFLGRTEDELLGRHPRDLSAGERLCLVLAIQLAAEPHVLLVDEPTRGLDAAARTLVGDALGAATASGAAVMVATHDRDFARRYATRTLTMGAGRIGSPAGVTS